MANDLVGLPLVQETEEENFRFVPGPTLDQQPDHNLVTVGGLEHDLAIETGGFQGHLHEVGQEVTGTCRRENSADVHPDQGTFFVTEEHQRGFVGIDNRPREIGGDDPFEGMARAYTELFIVRAESFKEQYLTNMAGDYDIDGFIYHDCKTCPNNSNNRYGMPVRLAEKLSIPYVVINGDLNDLRLYSEEQARTQFEALVEQISEAE